jgi:hypothetical protein
LVAPDGVIVRFAVLVFETNDLMHLQSRQQEVNVVNPDVKVLCHVPLNYPS